MNVLFVSGLMFTNSSVSEVEEYFANFRYADYARAGDLATETVELPEGLLPQFPFSIEPQLRKLGMPTKLEKGQVVFSIIPLAICWYVNRQRFYLFGFIFT